MVFISFALGENVCDFRLRSWRRPPLLLLCDAKASNYRNNKTFKDFGHYAEWPKVADVVIEAQKAMGKYFAVMLSGHTWPTRRSNQQYISLEIQ